MKFLKTNRSGGDAWRGDAWRVAALVLLAFLLRWLPALVPHFWYDEAYTVAMIYFPFFKIMHLTAADAHPPLYYFWVKLFAAVGRWLGGPFATLAWLRLASILPGLLTCLLAWGLARRHWGRRPALWTLALFAVSPALAYYSVELRNYALVQCLLLAGLAGLLGALAPELRRRRPAILLFFLAATLALYVHSLATLYLAAMGAIFLAEWILRRPERRNLLRRGAAALAPLALCYLPWVPILHSQNARINNAPLPWLPWAGWRDLTSTFLWNLPLGPLPFDPDKLWPWLVMALLGAGLLALIIIAMRNPLGPRTSSSATLADTSSPSPNFPSAATLGARTPSSATTPPAAESPSPSPVTPHSAIRNPQSNRLLLYSAALTVLPLLTSFTLSHFHFARVYLGYRYNLIAAPFFTLLLAGLIHRIPRPRWRRAVMISALTVGAVISAVLLTNRTKILNDLQRIADWKEPGFARPGARLCWANPISLPWLGRCGSFTIGSFEDLLSSPLPAAGQGDCYILNHMVFNTFSVPSGQLLERVLLRRKIAQLDPAGLKELLGDQWPTIWRLKPGELPQLAADLTSATRVIAARRAAIPGGQVVLADDPAFLHATGWSCPVYDNTFLPQSWTEGPRQKLTWNGPQQPGKYRLQIRFYRGNPFPEKTITTSYRLPGHRWKERVHGLGWVFLEAEVTTTKPRQRLTLELETPTWLPSERIPGSNDPRPLGMVFTGIELRPIK